MAMITTEISNGWLRARADEGPWVIIASDDGIANVRLLRRAENLFYIRFDRKEQPRQRMLVVVGDSITVGSECRAL